MLILKDLQQSERQFIRQSHKGKLYLYFVNFRIFMHFCGGKIHDSPVLWKKFENGLQISCKYERFGQTDVEKQRH